MCDSFKYISLSILETAFIQPKVELVLDGLLSERFAVKLMLVHLGGNSFFVFICSSRCISDESFMVGSAEIADYPVVYCSNGFSELTGFKRSDVMKFSCDGRFLYSSSVKKDVTESVETALRTKTSCQVEFIGNKKDGEKNLV